MSSTWLVTGTNRGLGLEFVRQLTERGDDVIATCRRPQEADELQALGARIEALDVADPESVAELVERLGERPIDVLVNNAGAGVRGRPLGDLDYEQLEHFFRVNSIAPLRLTESLLSRLRAGRAKRVVHVTSRMGSIDDNSSGGSYAYRASKAALNMISRSLAIDLRDEGIVSVVLHPGWVRTRMGGSSAPLTPEQSVAGMLEVIDGLDDADSGKFYDHSGEEVPW